MTEDVEEMMRAQLAEHLRVLRQLQLQERRQPPEPRMSNAMLLASPFGKLPQDVGVAAQSAGSGMTLVPGSPAALAPATAEPNLWTSGLVTLGGLLVLWLALRRLWE